MRKILIPIIAAFVSVLYACSGGDNSAEAATEPEHHAALTLDEILGDSAEVRDAHWDHPLDSAPDQGCQRLKIRSVGPLGRVFADSQYLQLAAAQEIGIGIITGDSAAWNPGKPIRRIHSNEHYYIDPLTHSFPYLVDEAADLLDTIGRRFNDSLRARGGGQYRIRVTSVLRSANSVKRLRRVNRNSVDSSAHMFGTTFDISHLRFACDGTETPRRMEDLKNLLAEILYDLREQGYCYVKHERKQSCFHITARPRPGKTKLSPQ